MSAVDSGHAMVNIDRPAVFCAMSYKPTCGVRDVARIEEATDEESARKRWGNGTWMAVGHCPLAPPNKRGRGPCAGTGHSDRQSGFGSATACPKLLLDVAKACDDVLGDEWSNRRPRQARPCVVPAPVPGRNEMRWGRTRDKLTSVRFVPVLESFRGSQRLRAACLLFGGPSNPRCGAWLARWSLHTSGHRSTGTRTFATQSGIGRDQTEVVGTRMGAHSRPWTMAMVAT